MDSTPAQDGSQMTALTLIPHRRRPGGHRWIRAGRSGLLSLVAVLLLLVASLPSASSAAAIPGAWTPTGNLVTGRYNDTATLLPNGQVLVAGGLNFGTYLAGAELYDPTAGTFTTTATLTMTTPRSGHTATLLPDGQVLVAGGYANVYLSSAELYNPSTGTWAATGHMITPRTDATATLLPTGQVLVAGGHNYTPLAGAELYDPNTGTWSATGSMSAAREGYTATLLPNGTVLAAGGCCSLASSDVYSPTTGTWTPTGSMITGRTNHTAALLPTGQVLVAGGDDSSANVLSSAELYDPTTGTFTSTASMATTRDSFTATLLPNGQVLVAGGCSATGCGIATAEVYDPAGATWIPTGAMSSGRYDYTATLLSSGQVLVAGGCGYYDCALASAELYATDTTPPTTTATLSPPPNAAGWNNSPVTVTLNAVDNPGGTGVYKTFYAVNKPTCAPGNERGCAVYQTPLPFTVQGQPTLYFFSMDNAGNTEAQQSARVNIDETPPRTTLNVSGVGSGCGAYVPPITVTLTAADNLSGVAGTFYAVDGVTQTYTAPFTLTAPGTHTVTYYSTDVAGNMESAHSTTLIVGNSPAIGTSVASGSYGDSVGITGSNFVSGERVNIYWDNASSLPIASANATSGCSFATTFNVPQGVAGTHTLIAMGERSKQPVAVPFTVQPRTVLSSSSGAQGSHNVLQGYGFAANETVTAYWNTPGGLVLGNGTTNALGTFSPGIGFTVPVSPTGTYAVYGIGQTSGLSASSRFTITPSLGVTPSSGKAGSRATIRATGYGAHETVTVKWDCAKPACTSTTVLVAATTDGNGDLSPHAVTIPKNAPLGAHTIGGIGRLSGAFASTTFTVIR